MGTVDTRPAFEYNAEFEFLDPLKETNRISLSDLNRAEMKPKRNLKFASEGKCNPGENTFRPFFHCKRPRAVFLLAQEFGWGKLNPHRATSERMVSPASPARRFLSKDRYFENEQCPAGIPSAAHGQIDTPILKKPAEIKNGEIVQMESLRRQLSAQ